MTKDITKKSGQWQQGQSGNPKGRPPKERQLIDILRDKGNRFVVIGDEPKTAREALAEAVWQFVITGEVWLNGRRLSAESVNEWANVVKWLYTYIEPPKAQAEVEPEMVVRVVRVDATPTIDLIPENVEDDAV